MYLLSPTFIFILLITTALLVAAYDGTGHVRCKKDMSGAQNGYKISVSVAAAGTLLTSFFCPPCAAIVGAAGIALGVLAQVPESFTCPGGTYQDGDYCVKDVSNELTNLSGLIDSQFQHCLHNVWGCQNDPNPNCQANVREQCKRDQDGAKDKIWRAMEGIERACND